MDISRAITEPFVQFLDFHRAFNYQFKAGYTAIRYVSHAIRGSNSTAVQDAFLAGMEKRWRDGHNWSRASTVLEHAAEDACRLAIVQIHSALDDLSIALRTEHDRWRDVSGATTSSRSATKAPHAEDEPLWKLCQDLGLQSTDLVTWRPLLALFRVMRNCIAHSSGTASTHLEELATSPALAHLLGSWPRRTGAKSPPTPSVTESHPIRISPKTVILCLDAAYRACQFINEQWRTSLGVPGICYSAAHFTLLDPARHVLSTSFRKANRAIGHTLSTRYKVSGAKQDVIPELEKLGVWRRCVTRHVRLYENSVATGLFKRPHGFKWPSAAAH